MRWTWLVLCAGCRIGFEPVSHGTADGAPGPDGPLGMGTYQVTETTVPYTVLASPTVVPGFVLLADDESYTVTLPFSFTYFGIAYTTINISMNGYVTFAAPGMDATISRTNDCPSFDGNPDAVIALFWDDLYANDTAPVGALGYELGGSAPDRTITIEWRDMDAFYQSGSGNNSFTQGVRVTQSLTLHETGMIEMHYGPRTPPVSTNQDCGAERHLGCSATVGLETPGAATGVMVQCGTPTMRSAGWTALAADRLITLTPPP